MYTRQPLSTGQRTLVTVVTNAEPLPLEQNFRQNDSSKIANKIFYLGNIFL
jgi:hypothetical protein